MSRANLGSLASAILTAAYLAFACGGSTVKDSSAGGSAGESAAGGSGGSGGTGGSAGATAGGSGGSAGEQPEPCGLLSMNDCLTDDRCVPLYRADQIKPGALPAPNGIPPDPCCTGCEQPACANCHTPRYVVCLERSACEQPASELCGYLPDGVCD